MIQEQNLEETSEDLEKIVKDSFSRMPKLHHPSDLIWTYEKKDSYFIYVRYFSRMYSDVDIKPNDTELMNLFYQDNVTFYFFTIYSFMKESRYPIHFENLHIHTNHRKKGFGTELDLAKEEILRELGFKFANVSDVSSKSMGFWRKMGYNKNCIKSLV